MKHLTAFHAWKWVEYTALIRFRESVVLPKTNIEHLIATLLIEYNKDALKITPSSKGTQYVFRTTVFVVQEI